MSTKTGTINLPASSLRHFIGWLQAQNKEASLSLYSKAMELYTSLNNSYDNTSTEEKNSFDYAKEYNRLLNEKNMNSSDEEKMTDSLYDGLLYDTKPMKPSEKDFSSKDDTEIVLDGCKFSIDKKNKTVSFFAEDWEEAKSKPSIDIFFNKYLKRFKWGRGGAVFAITSEEGTTHECYGKGEAPEAVQEETDQSEPKDVQDKLNELFQQ